MWRAYWGNCLSKNARYGVKNLYNGFKGLNQFPISIAIRLKLFCSLLKHLEEFVGRLAGLKFMTGGAVDNVYSRLFEIVTQCGVVNRLKVGRGLD